MIIQAQSFTVKEITYSIRVATSNDALALSELRLQIDGESENMDREKGEDFIDALGFEHIIKSDNLHPKRLLLVAESNGKILGYSRCIGNDLKRFAHKVEFGLGVLKDYWGYGVGRNLMQQTINWADRNEIKKMELYGVLETNIRGIELYKKLGFIIEGCLKNDRILSDGKYYHTYMMARFNDC